MKDIKNICKIALVQAEPVMFDKSASLKKALQCINEAAIQKPDIIVFPELFIPGYPVGMNFGFSMGKRSEEGRKDWYKRQGNDITMPLLLPEKRSVSNLQRQLRKLEHISALAFPRGMPLMEHFIIAMLFLSRMDRTRYTEN